MTPTVGSLECPCDRDFDGDVEAFLEHDCVVDEDDEEEGAPAPVMVA